MCSLRAAASYYNKEARAAGAHLHFAEITDTIKSRLTLDEQRLHTSGHKL